MTLDYKNLPVLLTVEEVAELLRCSVGTIYLQRKRRPGWLTPVRGIHSRRVLFATRDVLAAIQHDGAVSGSFIPEAAADPIALAEAHEQAAKQHARQRALERSRAQAEERQEWIERIAAHPPSARAAKLGLKEKVRVEYSGDGMSFSISMQFQERFRPPDWPQMIALPRGGPEWVKLETDDVMMSIAAEIDAVLTEYRPLWEAMKVERRTGKVAK